MDKAALKAELDQCETLNEMWDELDVVYNFDKPLGRIAKALIVNKLIGNVSTLVTVAGIKERG